MKVKELIALLQTVDPEARIFHGYDGDIVLTEPRELMTIVNEADIGPCWWRANIGDVVILENG